MKQPEFAAAALIALSLAACSKPAAVENISIDNDAASPIAGAPVTGFDAPNAVTAAAENAATQVGSAASPAKLPTLIPEQFQGRWGLVKADCTSTRGDAKGLLTISDARLTFYESKGTLNKVLGATANGFDADYQFSGEGQEWKRVERLTRDKGKLHRRTDAAAGQEPPVDLTYTRCGEWK